MEERKQSLCKFCKSTVILMASINVSGGANLKTVIAGGRVPGIADRQSVSAAFAQRLNAALTASKTTVKQLHAVVIGQAPVYVFHSLAAFCYPKGDFLARRAAEYINVLRSRSFNCSGSGSGRTGPDSVAYLYRELL